MNDDFPALLPAVRAIAEAAGREIMAIYRDESRWNVQQKADDSPLTAADIAANRIIVAGLRALTPEVPIISEECDETAYAERVRWPHCWLVDPLDGTREFIARNDEFSVNIALVEGDEAVLGVVHSPVRAASWFAARGHGAWCLEQGVLRECRVADGPVEERPLRIVASRRHRGARDNAFHGLAAEHLGKIELAVAGSAFKICAVAEGQADAYPRFGPTMEWDTAAGQVIVEAAGGQLLDAEGRPFRYNRRRTLRNGNFLVTGRAPEIWLPLWRESQAGRS